MGLEIDPNKSFVYVPVLDRTKLEAEQRKLRFRYLSARASDDMGDKLDTAKTYTDIADALRMALIGWENMSDDDGKAVAYDASKLCDVLTRAELHELRDDILSFATMDGLTKKKARIAVAAFYGHVCDIDGKGICVSDCPTPFQAFIIDCPACHARGCDLCEAGRITITSCARAMVTRDIWEMFRWVRRFEDHGILPVAGGGLDQTKSFLDAVDFFCAEMNYWKDRPRG